MNQLHRNISSLEIAEMVGRNHPDVMRDIRKIRTHLGESRIAETYFIESAYTDIQNKSQPCFLLTKKGCELFGTRMTGEKGTQFAVKYIERFNEMEEHIQQRMPADPVELALQTSLKNYQEIKGIKEDVDLLKDSMRIDGRQEFAIKSQGKAKVLETLGGYNSPAYNSLSKKVFSRMWRDFKNHFVLPRSPDLPKARFDEAVRYIAMWRPDTSTAIEIESYNNQSQLKLVQ
ncbi:Rha family transcriptional regulator [Solibacillus sp. R5-41]|uniref:Rha family transcriptional regulator n=1 Tax=Solibacillus sp. R5-41 TaxID=2048654 RepID=UPI001562B31C|nr:Rha family transcriptional regulator [Solibacillus sp. R5-41]